MLPELSAEKCQRVDQWFCLYVKLKTSTFCMLPELSAEKFRSLQVFRAASPDTIQWTGNQSAAIRHWREQSRSYFQLVMLPFALPKGWAASEIYEEFINPWVA